MEEIDSKDKKILNELYEDGRAQISKISKRTKIQRDSIKYRFNKLKKLGIISSIQAHLNFEGIGFSTLYKLDINLQNYNLKTEEEFVNYLKAYPNVLYIESVTGKFDLSIIIVAKTSSHFHKILREIRSKYPDVIRDHEISTLNKILKFWDFRALLQSQ